APDRLGNALRDSAKRAVFSARRFARSRSRLWGLSSRIRRAGLSRYLLHQSQRRADQPRTRRRKHSIWHFHLRKPDVGELPRWARSAHSIDLHRSATGTGGPFPESRLEGQPFDLWESRRSRRRSAQSAPCLSGGLLLP